jgi:ribosomal protein S18 acetylase RimI-like enzyme
MAHGKPSLQELAALAEETFIETYADQLGRDLVARYARRVFVPDLMTDVQVQGSQVLYARAQGGTVGYATLRPDDTTGVRTMRLDRIYVRSAHRRKGLGRQLMERAVAAATSSGMTTLRLGVWELNHRAIAFYQELGFEPCGEETFVLEELVQRDIVMVLALMPRETS